MASTEGHMPIVDSNSNCTTADVMRIPEDNQLMHNASCDLSMSKNTTYSSTENETKKIEGTATGKDTNIKTVSPTSTSAAKGSKTGDKEIFVPAPPPATNAWTKRMQQQGITSAKSPVTSSGGDGKHLCEQASGMGHKDADSTGQLNTVTKLKEKQGDGKCVDTRDSSNAMHNVTSSDKKQLASETGKPVKGKGEARPRQVSGEVAVPAVEGKGSDGSEPDAVIVNTDCSEKVKSASGKDDIKVTCDAVEKASINTSPKTGLAKKETVASVTAARTDERRGWEKNTSLNTGKNAATAKEADLKDSRDWPFLPKAEQGLKSLPNKETALSPTDATEKPAVSASPEVDEQTTSPPVQEGEDHAYSETSTVEQNHNRPLSDSGIEELPSKDAPGGEQSKPKKKGKGNKQKWLPVEIELPKTRRRRGTGRTRTDSREASEMSSRESGSIRRDTFRGEAGQNNRESGHEGFPRDTGRRFPREGRGGRDSSFRRSKHEIPGDKHTSNSRLPEDIKMGSASAADDEGSQASRVQESRPAGGSASSAGPPGRMGYQGSRRAAHRGRGGVAGFPYSGRGRYSQFPPNSVQYNYMEFGILDTTHYQYYPVEPATYFVPIVSQSDYYTSILADESAKKLIAQQIEYYFSTENLLKDFFLRRQMDSDGWIAVDLLASFRRVRIHTGTVNVELIVESMANSKIVEISSDRLRMRARDEPGKWSLKGVEPTTYSTLSIDVPEFVPGQPFKSQVTSPNAMLTKAGDGLSENDSLKSSLVQPTPDCCHAVGVTDGSSPAQKVEVSVSNLSSEHCETQTAKSVHKLDADDRVASSSTKQQITDVNSAVSDVVSVESSPAHSASSEPVDSDSRTQSCREEDRTSEQVDDVIQSTSDK